MSDLTVIDTLLAKAQRDIDSGWLPACQVAVAREGELVAFETLGDPGKASARERIVAALARSPAKPPMGAWTEAPPAT